MFQKIFKGSWLGILLLCLMATVPATVQAATKVETSAAIVSLTPSCSGISITGTGSHQEGIGRATFVLIDLTKDPTSSLVDSKDIYYSKPLPKQVTESWNSTVSLTPGTSYRVAFHIWAKTRPGPQLLASDLEDFTCT
jgi:hypothetical protein